MSIQVTLTFASEDELVAYFARDKAGKPAQAPAPAPGPATAKADAAPKKTAAAKTPAAQSAETPAPASTAATSDPETETPAVDYPTLQKAVFALANAKGRDAVIGLMKDTFNVGSAKELKPEQWAPALAAVNAALED